MGFGAVFAGPLVRSSYRAEEQRLAATGHDALRLPDPALVVTCVTFSCLNGES